MKRSTKNKITIVTFKSIRVVAWVVATVLGILGFLFLVAEPTESLGAGSEFFITMLHKLLISIVMFVIAFGAGLLASEITKFFKKYRIK